jgi:hypothetical protein
LSKSCLPSVPGKPFLFFDKPKSMTERDVELAGITMWKVSIKIILLKIILFFKPMQIYQERLSQLFRAFVKNADVRNDVLEWIGDCFNENQGINKEWSSHNPLTTVLFVSDGFLLNLNVVLLNLARPFAEPYSTRLLKIDPIYAISQNDNVHLKGNEFYLKIKNNLSLLIELYKETPLINREENENNSEMSFHFITEIFFMSHLSYSCSVHRIHRILLKVNFKRKNI